MCDTGNGGLHVKRMWKYLVAQGSVIFIVIGVIIVLPFTYYGPILSKVIIAVLIITYGGLCYRILLLPIDFLLGPVCRTMYCSGLRYMAEMHTCRAHCPVWKFYYGSNIVVSLLDPKLIRNKDIPKMQYLPKDVPLTVTFYRLSGIIIQIAGSGTNTVY